MPAYEFVLILRVLPKPELKAALKRAAESVMSRGGILHKIENLGTRQLPVKMRKYNMIYKHGSHFIFHFDAPVDMLPALTEESNRDFDVLRNNLVKGNEIPRPVSCALEDELLPPAYRPEVHKLIAEGRRKRRKQFDMHVDYYPF